MAIRYAVTKALTVFSTNLDKTNSFANGVLEPNLFESRDEWNWKIQNHNFQRRLKCKKMMGE